MADPKPGIDFPFTVLKVANIEAALDGQIAEKLAPTHSAGVPWS